MGLHRIATGNAHRRREALQRKNSATLDAGSNGKGALFKRSPYERLSK